MRHSPQCCGSSIVRMADLHLCWQTLPFLYVKFFHTMNSSLPHLLWIFNIVAFKKINSSEFVIGYSQSWGVEGVCLIVDSKQFPTYFTIYNMPLHFCPNPKMQSTNLQDFSQKKMQSTRIFSAESTAQGKTAYRGECRCQ